MYIYIMKILVIHPFDPSTEFLREIYANISATVVRTMPKSKSHLRKMMQDHDRIIGLGHGSPQGLFGWYGARWEGYAIGREDVDVLKGKDNVYVWCHANQFVLEHNLQGFSSGMFISEVSEAKMYNITVPRSVVEVSNYAFAFTLGRVVDRPSQQIFESVTKEYLDESDSVITFNNKRMITN